MKPSTHSVTVLLIKSWCRGRLKEYCIEVHMTYACAMVRISRFRREYPAQYGKLTKIKC